MEVNGIKELYTKDGNSYVTSYNGQYFESLWQLYQKIDNPTERQNFIKKYLGDNGKEEDLHNQCILLNGDGTPGGEVIINASKQKAEKLQVLARERGIAERLLMQENGMSYADTQALLDVLFPSNAELDEMCPADAKEDCEQVGEWIRNMAGLVNFKFEKYEEVDALGNVQSGYKLTFEMQDDFNSDWDDEQGCWVPINAPGKSPEEAKKDKVKAVLAAWATALKEVYKETQSVNEYAGADGYA